MDPVTIGALLAAVAAGAGGALGTQVWEGACALVRRPFHRTRGSGNSPAAAASGAAELAELEQAPGDEPRAVALAEVLVARACADDGFAAALAAWWEEACQVQIQQGGDVMNTVSGGTQYGPLLQGRDFSGLTFGAPAPPPSPAREQGRP